MSDNSSKVLNWFMTLVVGVWLLALTGGVIANDRLRVSEDQKIVESSSCFQKEVIQRLAVIETLVKGINK